MFSYYAIQFDKYDSYHSDITDYYSSPWISYREFVQQMKEEQKKNEL